MRIFVSYSWDDEKHKERVLVLAQRLRDDGIDAWIDRFTPFPAEGWSRWMREEIAHAQFVLCVVTKTYADRFLGRSGLGANWEGSIITNEIYQSGGRNEKFIPVLFDAADASQLPHPLNDYSAFRANEEDGYRALYRLLTGQPEVVPRPTGSLRTVPSLTQPVVHAHRRDRGNLPRLPYFFGRKADLETIAEALDPKRRTWGVLIDGPGGIGKTSLAVRAAESAPNDPYTRIFFFSCKSRELRPDGVHAIHDSLLPDYLEVLNALARDLGRDDILRLDENHRPAALNNALRNAPALLVIDNLESLAESDRVRVYQFLGNLPEPSKAIVTSRRRTDVEAKLIRLDRLPWEDAEALLLALAKDRPLLARASVDERRELYENSGGNPLILSWVAGQLGRGRCRTVAAALDLLRDSPSGDEAQEFIFGDLLDTFTNEETRLLAALTYFNEPMEVRHLAELAGVAALAAQPVLEGLGERALVLGDVESRRFVLTPLVVNYLRRARPDAVRDSGSRLANSAYALVIENGNENYDRFQALEEAWPTVAAALPVVLLGESGRLQTLCGALYRFLLFTGRWDEGLALNREAEERALAGGDFLQAGYRAENGGWMAWHRSRPDEVLQAADRTDAHWNRANAGSAFKAKVFHLRGSAYIIQTNYAAALTEFRHCLGLWQTISRESVEVTRALGSIADTERLNGDYDAADRDCSEALRIARKVGDTLGVAMCMRIFTGIALVREHWSDAEALAREALLLLEKMGQRDAIAHTLTDLAKSLVRQGRPAEGLLYARRAVDVLTQLRSGYLPWAQMTLRECEAGTA